MSLGQAKERQKVKTIKTCPKVVKVGDTYFGNAWKESPIFALDSGFCDKYKDLKPNFGFNGLGELVFYRTYSRLREDGGKESFFDVVKRCVEGCYEIQRRHCMKLHIPWDYDKAQESAQEMFDRMFTFKFLPPGRGLWVMGTEFMYQKGSAALNNCGMISTDINIHTDIAEPFTFMLDMEMLGVGVGFDTRGKTEIEILRPNPNKYVEYIIEDSREGWVDSLRTLIHSYGKKSQNGDVMFDYDNIRPEGSPIKGFGGTAAGPDILRRLHQLTRDHLEDCVGKTLSSGDIVDLMNYIGKCVVAGNVRRTAQIAFGELDDMEYITLKNAYHNLDSELIDLIRSKEGMAWERSITTKQPLEVTDSDGSVRIIWRQFPPYLKFEDFEVLPEGEKLEKFKRAINTWNSLSSHRWASNNSIFAEVGMDYTRFMDSVKNNGEPGFLWLDNCKNYGRMVDGYQEGIDGLAVGSNPCFTGDMRLLTEEGYTTMYDLWVSGGMQDYHGLGSNPIETYGSQKIVNNNGLVESTKVYRTGSNVDVWRVTMSDNSFIEATENHEFIVMHDDKIRKKKSLLPRRVKLSELKIGDKIPLNQTVHFGSYNDPAYAELAGWCIGDGSLSPKKDGQVRAECTCYDNDVPTVLPKLSALMHELYLAHNKSSNQQPAYVGWQREQEHFEHTEQRIGSTVLGRLLRNDGVRSGDKHRVPHSIWRGNRETVAAFIRGFASADGYVHISSNGTIGVRLAQSNKTLLEQIRLLLNQFGIASSVHIRKEAKTIMMNDGKGGKKAYNTKPGYELIISGIKQARSFLDQIGFIQNEKMKAARKWLQAHQGSNNSDTGRYTAVKSIEYLGKMDTYCLTEPATNQVVIEGYQVGQCSEQTLENSELCCLVETFPSRHENVEDYHRTLKFAFLYAKTVTLLPTHSARTNAVMLRNRRIGLSQSGIVQAFSKFGRRAVLRDFCDAGYKVIKNWDNIYSKWLCITPSIKVTSVKPSGTVSLLAGVSPGIHYPEAQHYWRRVRINKHHQLAKICADAGYHIEPAASDPENTVVIKFAISDASVKPTDQVSIYQQVANVVDYQRYWADNQVSVTIKVKQEEKEDIINVLETYEDQLKSISFMTLEGHGYVQAPYEPCTEEEVINYNKGLKPLDFSSYIEPEEGSKFCDGDSCSV